MRRRSRLISVASFFLVAYLIGSFVFVFEVSRRGYGCIVDQPQCWSPVPRAICRIYGWAWNGPRWLTQFHRPMMLWGSSFTCPPQQSWPAENKKP